MPRGRQFEKDARDDIMPYAQNPRFDTIGAREENTFRVRKRQSVRPAPTIRKSQNPRPLYSPDTNWLNERLGRTKNHASAKTQSQTGIAMPWKFDVGHI